MNEYIKFKNNTLKVSNELDINETLNLDNLYKVVVKKQGLEHVAYNEIYIDDSIKRIVFKKKNYSLLFELSFLDNEAVLIPFVTHRNKKIFECSKRELDNIIEFGYSIYQNTCYPIDNECFDDFRKLLTKSFDSIEFKIPIKEALDALSSKINPYLHVIEDFNFDNFLENDSVSNGENKLFIRELYSYQQEGVNWMKYCCLNSIGTILGDDMGLGKTAQVIALISWYIQQDFSRNVLIVVPSTLMENWKREFEFFSPLVVPYIHHGNSRTGLSSVLKEHKIVITSYSLIINDFYIFKEIHWGLIVTDEASLLKNPEAERTKFIKRLDSDVNFAMTGTPIENSLSDLWSITDFVYPGYLGDYDTFSDQYIRRNLEDTIAQNLDDIEKKVSRILIRRMKEDLLDTLPDKIEIHQALTMGELESKLYDECRNEIIESCTERNHLKLIMQLRRYTSHPYLIRSDQDDFSISDLTKVSNKLSRTLELLEEINNKKEKVLIFTTYLDMIDILSDLVSKKFGIEVHNIDGRVPVNERQIVIDQFSNIDGFSVLVLNPETAGMGLNIVAANHVIHYTRQWNPALELQASARSYRNGQKLGVNIYYLYYVDTIEEVIDKRLRLKQNLSDEIIQVIDTKNDDIEYFEEILKLSPIGDKI